VGEILPKRERKPEMKAPRLRKSYSNHVREKRGKPKRVQSGLKRSYGQKLIRAPFVSHLDKEWGLSKAVERGADDWRTLIGEAKEEKNEVTLRKCYKAA